jgi:hypothetical protein
VTIDEFLATFELARYEDKEKYEKEWLPLVEKYGEEMNEAVPAE